MNNILDSIKDIQELNQHLNEIFAINQIGPGIKVKG